MEMVQQDEVLKTHPRVTSIPGPTSSATNVSMVVSAGPWSSEKAEMNNLEINKKSHPQLVENKQEFRNLQQKFLVTQVAYFLANGQNNYGKFCRLTITKVINDVLSSL
ncbi:neuroblastoma breakpoint family member 3-like isoform X1 [Hylobates moloch]|uniref:neuroblastoma breakpoint family member 3-like isoform X1 n=1 Tax=Hylobates moloch TaxID=81572 RepID=UPI001362094E|nr:neuroblastoma breakpoint family member 3-like isoform X1 [Hylobates moloch]